MSFVALLSLLLFFCACDPVVSDLIDQPFAGVLQYAEATNPNSLLVDLGYAVYEGLQDTQGYNVWRGIRYAASTEGANRWQPPVVPPVNRSTIIKADKYGDACPQSFGLPGSEDCLYLNVDAPPKAVKLPVMVWIHGGGYNLGNNALDYSELLKANNDTFIGVSIQYRLGAFGFLSSTEVAERGVVNAGILDTIRALQWVQAYIQQFGGDPSRVTIVGESAGAGLVMLLGMAYNGTLGTSLFVNSIAASPYQPTQRRYNAEYLTRQYYNFVEHAGCSSSAFLSTFECLVNTSSEILQDASSYIAGGVQKGDVAFAPVTDGFLVPDLPARYLRTGEVNGLRVLTGNNALEGFTFTPRDITSQANLVSWLRLRFPAFTEFDIKDVLRTYPISAVADDLQGNARLFATDGIHSPTAINQSSLATGQQQRANNIFAEVTFDCPSYWLAEAYSPRSIHASDSGVQGGYKYQYSILAAVHGTDAAAYFYSPAMPHSSDFSLAVKKIFGNFITQNNPSIDSLTANGASTSNNSVHPASAWPIFMSYGKKGTENVRAAANFNMINLNETFTGEAVDPVFGPPSDYPEANVKNSIDLVDAWSWEGGRGQRCDFWKRMGAKVAEERDAAYIPITASGAGISDLTPSLHRQSTFKMKLHISIGIVIGLGLAAMLAAVGATIWQWWMVRKSEFKFEDDSGLEGLLLTDCD